jgi:hypothetical protein
MINLEQRLRTTYDRFRDCNVPTLQNHLITLAFKRQTPQVLDELAAIAILLSEKLSSPASSSWIYVESDSIYAISRDVTRKTVSVLFRSNLSLAYVYNNIPDDIWTAWLADRSKGKFYHRNIKDKYVSTTQYVRI